MRRTTSMSGFAVPPEEEAGRQPPTRAARGASAAPAQTEWGASQRRHSGDFNAAVETAAFLKACGLCCRRLGPGRDTFIYIQFGTWGFSSGEVAFCSLECRQQQMNLDELMTRNASRRPAAAARLAPAAPWLPPSIDAAKEQKIVGASRNQTR
ncbi:hypothetical protein ZWY2020_051145 [Hordeum vulgare]|nr:hypothetical protein ZWY2020_051145 [Hordeum vulgare]